MKTTRMPAIFLISLLVLSFAADKAFSDDGYDLWLKYNKISDAQKLSEYQEAISSVFVQGDSPTCTKTEEIAS